MKRKIGHLKKIGKILGKKNRLNAEHNPQRPTSSSLVPPERVPMGSSRSGEHVRHVTDSHVPPPHHPHPVKCLLALPQQPAGYKGGEADLEERHELTDAVFLKVFGYLTH